jgi:cell division transport system ATP-binding protein
MQVIRLTGVYKSYKKGGLALRNVSLNIRKGEFVFLTGPSGAGKSTLLKLIYMELRPTEGEVRVSGYSSAKIHRREIPYLRRRLGIIFQDFRLLKNRTAFENVAFALEVTGTSRGAIGPKVQRTLAAVGLGQKGDRYPRELSGGEQQRVAIARSLVNDPFILLADEPTGNLDTRVSLELLRILREINSLGMAVLLATHDYTLLNEHSEARVLHLENGALVSDSAAAPGAAPGLAGEAAGEAREATASLRTTASPLARPVPPQVAEPRFPSAGAPRKPAAADRPDLSSSVGPARG